MTTEGVLLTCDRCGKTTFKAKTGTQFNTIDGYCEESPVYESQPFWDLIKCYPIPGDPSKSIYVLKMLCPECRKELADILTKFWRIIEV